MVEVVRETKTDTPLKLNRTWIPMWLLRSCISLVECTGISETYDASSKAFV